MNYLSDRSLTEVICKRPADSYKGTFGHVVLIGGNATYGGAIVMSAEAAVKAGAGLVSVVTHVANHAALHARLPEAMVLDWQQEAAVIELLAKATVVLIGPGLGLDEQSEYLVSLVLSKQTCQQWVLIDGSAITLLARKDFHLSFPQKCVFTPHQVEWQRLSKLDLAEQTLSKNWQVQQKMGAIIVLKSHRTTLYTAEEIYQNPLGTPAMATGGMGDTLAGIITGFLAQFPQKIAAICAAVYIHSFIGESLAKTNYVVLPTEISNALPHFMKKFEHMPDE